jgi:hypothetical protein
LNGIDGETQVLNARNVCPPKDKSLRRNVAVLTIGSELNNDVNFGVDSLLAGERIDTTDKTQAIRSRDEMQ